MARSKSHQLGEFIGAFFEDLMKKPIREFANKYGLYFDTFGPRKARRGKKLTWSDVNGSKHDLDSVIEKGGTEEHVGEPVAFIELAWRSYTKHSKNKVQEISGAVNPICEKYKLNHPFKGAILSGQFTESSLSQLKSDNFHVLFIPFEKLVQAFSAYGLDIDFDEDSKEADVRKKYAAVSKRANRLQLEKVREEILKSCDKEIKKFVAELEASYTRKIKSISILPLHGCRTEVVNVEKAIDFIKDYNDIPVAQKMEYIEIIVTYNIGSIIQCQFKTKSEAIDFLNMIKQNSYEM